jgi:hypothetical protein
MDDVRFPRRKAEAILAKTMRSVGYDKALTEVGVWSAMWLNDRGHAGLINLVVYLCLIRGRNIKELLPTKHPEFGLAGICPFMMAQRVIELSDKWLPVGSTAFGAPAEPFLMMASVADWAATRGYAVRFHHLNYSCLMSARGIEIETPDLSLIGWINPEKVHPMKIELTKDRPADRFVRADVIALPEKRFRGWGALDLT